MTRSVYLAVPHIYTRQFNTPGKDVHTLLKRLGLGLIIIHFRENGNKDIEVLINPSSPRENHRIDYKKRKALFKEMDGRYRDFNTGGTPSIIETVSAYRLKALYIAVLLKKKGELSPSRLRALGADPSTQSILSNNYYGWFKRVKRGIYTLSETGRTCFVLYPEQSAYLTKKSARFNDN